MDTETIVRVYAALIAGGLGVLVALVAIRKDW
jgi:hypothetical protein